MAMHPPRLLYPLALLTLTLLLARPAISRGQDAWNTYPDTDPRLRYTSTAFWQTFAVAAALGGTLTGTADPGATLTAYFEGTAVQLVYSLGPEGRTFSAQVDDGPLSTVYSYGDGYSHGHTLAFSDLPAGVHVLTVTNGDGALWIEAVQVRGELLAPPATPTPAQTTPLGAEAELILRFSDNFDGELNPGWMGDTNALHSMLTPHDDGHALRVSACLPPLQPMIGGLGDQVLRTNLLVEAGKAHFFFRQSPDGQYALNIERDGHIELYRNDALLAAVSFVPLTDWHFLQVSILDNTITVAIDHTQILSVPDPAHLPQGTLAVAADLDNHSRFQVDDFELWIPAQDFSVAATVTPAPGTILAPQQSTFSAGGQIVYVAEPYGLAGSTIHRYDFDTQTDQLVATPPSFYGYTHVAWSPDQSKIAAVLTDYGGGGEVEDRIDYIVVMNADGSGIERRHPYYTDTPVWSYGVTLSGVSWSPDGTKIAFAAAADRYQQGGYTYSSYAIYYIDAACTGDLVFCRATSLTADGQNTHDYDPAWGPLPDQPALAFRRERLDTAEARIYTTTLSGTPAALSPAGQKMYHPAWSPDGGSLLTTRLQDNGAGQFIRSIWLVPVTGAPQQVSFPAADSHHDYPDWSPDGNGFIFGQYQTAGYSSILYTKPLQGAEPASTGIAGRNPRWYRPPGQQQRCLALPFPRPIDGRHVRKNRNFPLSDADIKRDANGNKMGIPQGATVFVAYKAVSDLSLWYYIEGYIDPTSGQLVTLVDADGIEGDADGNWIFQRNLINGPQETDGSDAPWCGLTLQALDGSFTDLDNRCEPTSEITAACQTLPWAEPPDCDGGELSGDLCIYSYDRDKAVTYATLYAAWPNPTARPGYDYSSMFCTYNYGGAHTHCAPPEKPLPPEDPNASEINCVRDENGNCLFPSDCANFTSIALWYGGLPMTERWFCEGVPCPSAGTSENYSWTNAASSGQPQYLIVHLPRYATDEADVFGPFIPTYDHDNNPDTEKVISYLNPYARPDFNKMAKIREIWQGDPYGYRIAKGDIVWTAKQGAEHMMIVAGWGPLLVTWEEIDAFWEAHRNPDGSYNYAVLTTTYPEPNHDFGYNPHPEFGYVPYLVDHGPQGAAEEGPGGIPRLICSECVKPRPYYALYWQRDVRGTHKTYTMERLIQEGNAPCFIHIPDEIAVPVEEVKASPANLLGVDRVRDIPPVPVE